MGTGLSEQGPCGAAVVTELWPVQSERQARTALASAQQMICNQVVEGSSPLGGSTILQSAGCHHHTGDGLFLLTDI
jgi:hypothetical protein